MNHGWFKLLIRAMGVYFLVPFVTSTVEWAFQMVAYYSTDNPYGAPPMGWQHFVASVLVILFQGGVGIYMVCGAPAFVRWCLRETRNRCPQCDLDVRDLAIGLCPECGFRLRPSGDGDAPMAGDSKPA